MEYAEVMTELESLGKERTKKMYLSNGAVEPLFGVTTGSMKPMRKAIKIDQDLAEELYASGNYDAMYFAGVIADANAMTEADYDRWMDQAYCFMLADWVVAVTLSEANIAQEVAEEIGELVIEREHKKPQTLNAYASIQKEIERDRIGFKRKYVRC